MYHIVKAKIAWELDKLAGIAAYPFRKDEAIARLSSAFSDLSVETTNICNANCVFCAYQFQERPAGVMSLELFEKIIADYVECGGGRLSLTPTVGEPLADKHILERIQLARARPEIASIGMYSNMINLGRFGAKALVESGLTGLVVSTSGLDESMYERVYRSKLYQKMLANIKAFAIENNAHGRPVEFLLDLRTDRSLREVMSYPDHREVAALVGSENIHVKFRYDSWSGRITKPMLTGSMKLRLPLIQSKLTTCTEMYSGPMVYWDGKVGACGCRDLDASELIIGNVAKEHLGEIWFGAELQRLRDEFMTDRRKPICDTCSHYNGLTNLLRPSLQAGLPHEPSPYVPLRRRGGTTSAPASSGPTSEAPSRKSLPVLPSSAHESRRST